MKQADETRLNFTLIVYNSIKSSGKLPELSIPRLNRQYYITRLKRAKLVRKIGYGTWEVLQEYDENKVKQARQTRLNKSKLLGLIEVDRKIMRSHAFRFKVALPKLQNWERRLEYLKDKNIQYTQTLIGQKLFILGKKVWLCNKCILFHCRADYLASLAKGGKNYAIDDLLTTLSYLESLLNCSFRIGKRYKFKVIRAHYALMRQELAKFYRKNGEKLYVYSTKGYWFWIDFSEGIDEVEVGNIQQADKIMDENIAPFINGLKEDNAKGFTPQFVVNSFAGVAQNQIMFDKNFSTHLQILTKIGTAVDELTLAVKKLEEKFKYQNI